MYISYYETQDMLIEVFSCFFSVHLGIYYNSTVADIINASFPILTYGTLNVI